MRGNADADQYSRTGLSIGTGAVSMCGWCYMTNDRNDWQTPFGLNGATSAHYLYIGPHPNGSSNIFKLYGAQSGPSSQAGAYSMTAGNWYFWGFTRTGTTGVVYFREPSDIALSTDSNTNADWQTDVDEIIVLDNVFTSEWWDGRVNAIKVWDGVILTADEMLIESYFYMPMTNLSSIVGATDGMVLPLIHADDDTVDYSGNGNNLTASGTPTTEDGPPIVWAPSAQILRFPSVAAPPAAAIMNQLQFGNLGADLYNGTLQ